MSTITDKPPSISLSCVDNIPTELRELPQWVCWRWEQRDGKWTKPPINPKTGKYADSTNQTTWGTFDEACKYAAARGYGIGYVFAQDDLFCGIDFDDCRNSQDGSIDVSAWERIGDLNSYSEISPSGKGVKVIASAKLPGKGRKKGPFEMYDSGRFFTITGQQVKGTPESIESRQSQVEALYRAVFGEESKPDLTKLPVSDGRTLADDELIEKAKSAQNGNKFSRLWAGDWSGYPSQSEADLALCSLLAFWTNGDAARIDKLFKRSGLFREKWNDMHGDRTFGDITIATALKNFTRGYGDQTSLTGFHCTDLGNAGRLVARHGNDLRYCAQWKAWYVWDGRRWAKDTTGEVYRKAQETIRQLYKEAADEPDDGIRTAMIKWALQSESRERIEAMVAMARSAARLVVVPEQFDADPFLFNCKNGTIESRMGKLREHRKEDLLTKLSPVSFDPQATCPTWDRFLLEIMNEKSELVGFLRRAVGYALTGDTSEQCLFMGYGTGANGKSTFFEMLRFLLGEYGQQADFSTFLDKKSEGVRNDIARMVGARLVCAVEAGEGKKLAEVVIKQLTGSDTVTSRFLYSEYFEYRPQFKLFLAMNHKPIIRETSNAIWRRVRLIPFSVCIPEEKQDKTLLARLRGELSGILAWAVRGCLEWQAAGLGIPQEIRDATGAYRDEMDVLGGFLSDCCLISKNAEAKASDLYHAYKQWHADNGENEKPLSQRSFGMRLSERGFVRTREGSGRILWYGLGLASPPKKPNIDTGEGGIEGFSNEPNDSNEETVKSNEIPHEGDFTETSFESFESFEPSPPCPSFVPSADWQTVPEGTILPNGLEVKTDLQTGKQKARIDPRAAGFPCVMSGCIEPRYTNVNGRDLCKKHYNEWADSEGLE